MSWAGERFRRVKSGFALMELSLVAKSRSVLDAGTHVLETPGDLSQWPSREGVSWGAGLQGSRRRGKRKDLCKMRGC